MTLVSSAFGNAAGRILSGWMSDRLGRITSAHDDRDQHGRDAGAVRRWEQRGLLYAAVFVVYGAMERRSR